MNLFLLAAGEGTRFRPHTMTLPKPALPFCGAPLIYYSYFLAKCLNPQNLVINTYHLPVKMHEVGKTLESFGVKVHFSDEQPLLLGSAGGMAKARDLLRGQNGFVALNADEVIIPRQPEIMRSFYDSAQASQKLAVLMVMKHPEAGKKFGAVWVNPSGRVLGFGKVPPETSETLTPYHFIGPMYFQDKIFDRLKVEPSNILHDTLKLAIAEGEDVGIYPIECEWFETGNLEDYLRASEAVLNLIEAGNAFLEKMQTELELGFTLETTRTAKLLKHDSARVETGVEITGWAILGANTRIKKDAVIRNSVVADGVEIQGSVHHSALLLK